MKEKYDTSRYIDTYISISREVMFTYILSKNGIKKFGERSVADIFKGYQQLNDVTIPGKPVFGPISNY